MINFRLFHANFSVSGYAEKIRRLDNGYNKFGLAANGSGLAV